MAEKKRDALSSVKVVGDEVMIEIATFETADLDDFYEFRFSRHEALHLCRQTITSIDRAVETDRQAVEAERLSLMRQRQQKIQELAQIATRLKALGACEADEYSDTAIYLLVGRLPCSGL
jgi:hypothetical protein